MADIQKVGPNEARTKLNDIVQVLQARPGTFDEVAAGLTTDDIKKLVLGILIALYGDEGGT